VAFRTPSGQIVLLVLNDSGDPQSCAIRYWGMEARATLPAATLATLVWPARRWSRAQQQRRAISEGRSPGTSPGEAW
jgi:hypothetical protein